MAAPVLVPEPQFCDADGKPYAGGTIATYVRDTTTPKPTWTDPGATALNTNPIILDAAGRCQMWGDGEYRLILRDAAGNEIWDAPSTTLVSAAMAPVILAPTIADAVHLLGIDDMIAAEAAARAAADSAEQSARIAADNAEIAARTAAIANLQSQIDAINALIAGLPTPGAGLPIIQHGFAISNSDGHIRVTFTTPFASAPDIAIGVNGAGYQITSETIAGDTHWFDAWFAYPSVGGGPTPDGTTPFYWIAVGT